MTRLRTHLALSLRTAADAWRNPNLRRLQLALTSLVVGQWAYTVAVAVYAYGEGGAAAVGLVGLVRMLPSAFAAPLTAFLADRHPRRTVLLVAGLAEGLGVALTAAAVLADAPSPAVYALTAVVQVATTAAVPTRAALMPSLARTPRELAAANVGATTIDSVGSFVGPALGGLLLAFADVGTVLGAVTAAFALAGLLISRIRVDEPAARPRVSSHVLVRELAAGFRAIATEPDLRLVTGLYAAQTLVGGALNVLLVVASLELLGFGDAGVGYLNAAIGMGGLAGSAVALALVPRGRLASDFALGMLLWGVPMILVGLWAEPAFALLVLAVLGVGNTLVDVSGVTLLQRSVSDAVLARVFGVLESLTWATIALGSVMAATLAATIGVEGAFIAVGALLPVLTVLAWPRLAAIDGRVGAPEAALALLRAVPFLAPIPGPQLEQLARALERTELPAGATVVREGDPGDRFYVVESGQLDVERDGARGSTLGPGDYFGEIALLRAVPRTATIRARTDAVAHALDREPFVAAVAGHAESGQAADSVVAARLRALRPAAASR